MSINLEIQLNSGNARGANYGSFLVKSKEKFTWEAGRAFAELILDDEIYRYNLLLKNQAKKNKKSTSRLHYQWSRAGPIVKCLGGPCMEPKYFPPSKWDNNEWFCAYRYKAKTDTTTLMEYGGIDISKPWSKEKPNVDMGDDDEPLY